MDEQEVEIQALTLLAIEWGALLDRIHLEDSATSIAAGVGRGGRDEDAVRIRALEIIEDARARWRPDFPMGRVADYLKLRIPWPREDGAAAGDAD